MKTNKKLIVVIIILIIALLGTITYIVYDKVIERKEDSQIEEKKEKPKEKEPESRNLTEAEIETLLSQIEDMTPWLGENYPIDENHPLDNQKALYFSLIELGATGKDFMESDLEKVLEKYFGKDHPYYHEDIICTLDDTPLYKYNSAKREYTYQDVHGHGGPGTYPTKVFYADGQTDGTTYQINVNILYESYYGDTGRPTTSYYATLEDSSTGQNPVYTLTEDQEEIAQEDYENIKTNLPITKAVFVKDENNNYGLQSIATE